MTWLTDGLVVCDALLERCGVLIACDACVLVILIWVVTYLFCY